MSTTEHPSNSRTWLGYLGLMARGLAMGALEIVPGISGGTMALILGIYEELIDSIKGVLNRDAIRLLLRFKIKQALDLLPWKFLASLAIGILIAAFSMSFIVEWVLTHYPILLWSFFFGLIVAAALTVGRQVRKWTPATILSSLVGAVAMFMFVGLVPIKTPDTWWFLFISGAVAICGLALPGMSGSFILVLLGKYEYVLSAVTRWDFVSLFMVIVGAAVGVVTIAQLVSWLLHRYHSGTLAFLAGMLIGSLRKIWPWKQVLAFVLDRHGQPIPTKEINILPAAWTWEVALGVTLAVIGFVLLTLLNVSALRRESAKVS
jgi:putative membrane protein